MTKIADSGFSLRGVHVERAELEVLHGVTADLPAGRVSVLVGRSGSGKTTLLRLLNRLDEPSAGTIHLDGLDLREIPIRELRRTVGFVFQEPVVFPGTVEENLRTAVDVAETVPEDLAECMTEALRDAELPPDFRRRDARDLSGGERQRVTLARALVLRPRALLLDEPTSALDPDTADRIVSTVREMSERRGLTVVVSTHRLAEARELADHVLVLRDGRVAAAGTPAEVLGAAAEPEDA